MQASSGIRQQKQHSTDQKSPIDVHRHIWPNHRQPYYHDVQTDRA